MSGILRKRRMTKNWSQTQLVKRLRDRHGIDVSREYVGMIENGERVPSMKLAAALGDELSIIDPPNAPAGTQVRDLAWWHQREAKDAMAPERVKARLVAAAREGYVDKVLHELAEVMRSVADDHPVLALDIAGAVAEAMPDVIQAIKR